MRVSVKTIKFTAIASVVLLILTYLISVNAEAHFINLKTAWLTDSFLMTLFGGAFASMLVVLLCEIHRYSVEKHAAEDAMFYNAMYLYDELYMLKMNIKDFQDAPDKGIHEKMAEGRAAKIQNIAWALERIEYCTLRNNNILFQKNSAFIAGLDTVIRPVFLGSNFLQQSVLLVKIENVKSHCEKPVTSADQPVRDVLAAEQQKLTVALDYVDSFLTVVDSVCSNRYNWSEKKTKTHTSYVNYFDAAKLDDFIRKTENN